MSTTFYAAQRSSNVNVPNNKVCGYRIKNPWMKNGFSDGVKAGRDNGVVEQKLSRFATEQERKEAGSNCEGNTNWLNHRGPKFNMPESADNQFSIKRVSFKEGTVDNSQRDADMIPKNIRGGLGNRDITRNNFLSPSISARMPLDFDKLQIMAVDAASSAVVSSNRLGYFTNIKVPDPTDIEWLREEARMRTEITARFATAGFTPAEVKAMVDRELRINKPLGRGQRTVNQNSDIIANETRLSTAAKLGRIFTEVRNGRAENVVGQQALTQQLVGVFTDTQAIQALTTLQLNDLGAALARIGVPTNHKRLGIEPRFVDINFYNANAGIINLLFFSKVRETPNTIQFNYDKMVRNFPTHPPDGLPAMTLRSMVSAISIRGPGKRYLDLELGGVIDRFEMRRRAAAANGGFNNPDFAIDPANR